MALYTALAGVHPEQCLPVLLDVGTDNEDRLGDPLYVGWQHKRMRGRDYDDFVDAFVSAVKRRWPHVLLQWEDFAGSNAARLLDRYRNQLCTFNDDIQGTAAVATRHHAGSRHRDRHPLSASSELRSLVRHRGNRNCEPVACRYERRWLSDEEARKHFYAIDRYGLIVEGGKEVRPEQQPFAQKRANLAGWKLSESSDEITLLDVVHNARITVLGGVSGQPGAFTEKVVREMARHADHPVIFPLSNPTSRAEATPSDLLKWTDGRALVGSGSPFPPVEMNSKLIHIAQINNSYIFPGLALGILASKAKYVSDAMIMASAKALAALSPTHKDKNANLLPPIADSRKISLVVAEAVGKQAIAEGVAGVADSQTFDADLHAGIWEPIYRPYERLK